MTLWPAELYHCLERTTIFFPKPGNKKSLSYGLSQVGRPITTNDQVELPSTTKPFLDLPDIDVTKLISGMVSSNQNYGFMLRMKNEVKYTSRIFCSSKFADASKHPKLVVIYKLN